MTNLQEGATRISGQSLRRLWLFTPIAIGAVVAAVIGAAALLPVLGGVRESSERLRQLEGLREELGLLRTQLVATDANILSNEERKSKILGLIAGSGNLSTFLSRLQKEADRTGVQLELFEPQAGGGAAGQPPNPAGGAQQPPANQNQAQQPADQNQAQPPANQNQAQQQPNQNQAQPPAGQQATPPATAQAAATPSGPPELQGLKRQTSLITVRGTYPQLLTFMRNLEALNVLVVQSDLDLSLEDADNARAAAARAAGPVTLKFSVSLYSPSETNPASPAAGTAN